MLNIAYIHTFCTDKLCACVPSYKDNPNLNTQKGLFLYWRSEINEDIDKQRLSIDKKIDEYVHVHKIKNEAMFKFNITYNQIVPALKYLFKRNMTASLYFPGYDGIKQEIKEFELARRIENAMM
jgi:hypothetical protein